VPWGHLDAQRVVCDGYDAPAVAAMARRGANSICWVSDRNALSARGITGQSKLLQYLCCRHISGPLDLSERMSAEGGFSVKDTGGNVFVVVAF
jgi:hypothetical protein